MSEPVSGKLFNIIRNSQIDNVARMDILVTIEIHDDEKYFLTRLGHFDEKGKFNTAGSGIARNRNMSFAFAMENFAINVKDVIKQDKRNHEN